jgi:hypothetical protein
VLEGAPAELAPEDVEQAYFGLAARAHDDGHHVRWPHGRHEAPHGTADAGTVGDAATEVVTGDAASDDDPGATTSTRSTGGA